MGPVPLQSIRRALSQAYALMLDLKKSLGDCVLVAIESWTVEKFPRNKVRRSSQRKRIMFLRIILYGVSSLDTASTETPFEYLPVPHFPFLLIVNYF